jgi:hypothetical protein
MARAKRRSRISSDSCSRLCPTVVRSTWRRRVVVRQSQHSGPVRSPCAGRLPATLLDRYAGKSQRSGPSQGPLCLICSPRQRRTSSAHFMLPAGVSTSLRPAETVNYGHARARVDSNWQKSTQRRRIPFDAVSRSGHQTYQSPYAVDRALAQSIEDERSRVGRPKP